MLLGHLGHPGSWAPLIYVQCLRWHFGEWSPVLTFFILPHPLLLGPLHSSFSFTGPAVSMLLPSPFPICSSSRFLSPLQGGPRRLPPLPLFVFGCMPYFFHFVFLPVQGDLISLPFFSSFRLFFFWGPFVFCPIFLLGVIYSVSPSHLAPSRKTRDRSAVFEMFDSRLPPFFIAFLSYHDQMDTGACSSRRKVNNSCKRGPAFSLFLLFRLFSCVGLHFCTGCGEANSKIKKKEDKIDTTAPS